MWNHLASFYILPASLDALEYVQVVLDVLQRGFLG